MPLTTLIAPLLLIAAPPADADPQPGTVAIMLADAKPGDPADQPFADAVGQALGEANFTVMPGARHGRYIALVSVARAQRGVVTTKGGKGDAVTGIGSFGPMVAVPLGSGAKQLSDLTATTLTVRLVTQADRRLVWSGSAVTVRTGSATVPVNLARAAVATFPRTVAAPMSVP